MIFYIILSLKGPPPGPLAKLNPYSSTKLNNFGLFKMEASPELPTSITSLIFPTSSYTNFSKTLSSLKRATLCITNRLRSIEEDSRFVHRIAELYNLPLVANERCGSWYISPERKAGSAYFKSTDGHQGQWGFSKRRLNLHILEIIEDFNGYASNPTASTGNKLITLKDSCIIVDSTRRGKRMPDALSKTIPIWCVVINMLLFPQQAKAHLLHTPPDVIAQSEHAQIEARLKSFLDDAKVICHHFLYFKANSLIGNPI